jgi:hypothetical protein
MRDPGIELEVVELGAHVPEFLHPHPVGQVAIVLDEERGRGHGAVLGVPRIDVRGVGEADPEARVGDGVECPVDQVFLLGDLLEAGVARTGSGSTA